MTADPVRSDSPTDADDLDYGYDLAHEVKTALRIPVSRRPPSTGLPGTGRTADSDGDLGYDDCHDR
jgi:hypothetical protein